MKNKFLLAALVLFFFGKIGVFAQSTSNRGKDFWVAYAGHIDGLGSRMTLFLSSDVSTTYQVTSGGSIIASGSVVANVVTPVFINPNSHNVYIGSSNVKELNKGINVTSVEPISVYCVISNNARTGSTLVLPTAALEQEYYVFSQQNMGNSNIAAYSEFSIVGVKDGTTVEIKPTQTSIDGGRLANSTFQITLNKGDVYQYQAEDDLTGTLIKSVTGCSPIAVFSGTTWAAFCEPGNSRTPNGGDNLFQQLFPVTAWGKNFVSAPFYNTLNGNTDIIKIIVSEDNTTVTVNGSTTTANGTALSNPYRKGSVITFYTTSPNVIKATSPVAVAQYQTSQTCNLANAANSGQGGSYLGDPEMTILNPIEQTLKDIAVYSRLNSVTGVNTNISRYFLNIIIKTVDIPGFTLDGTTITSQFRPIANSEYSYAIVDVTNSSDQHRLIASGGFVAIAYGYGQVESYAYLAGTDLKNLKSNIQVFTSGSTIASTNFCLGTDFDFVLKLPYVTNKLSWDLNNGAKTEIINAPAYTTTVEDGITYYLYKYSLPSANFSTPGNYVLKVLIEKAQGAICATDEEIFTTFDVFSPNISFPTEACENTDVQFTDSSPRTGGNIKTWSWNFGDGGTSTLQHPKHKFATAGTKTVTLNVTTDIGCNLSVSKTINILAPPKSAFTAVGPFCINATIQFNNESTFVNSNIASQKWDFGNGKPESSAASPTTTYTAAGNYTVKLISVSSSGCADTLSKVVTIYETPEVTFKDPGSCVNDVVQYEGTAVKGNITAWLWDFGDGSNDVVQKVRQNPTHKYTAPGNYTVTLIATSEQGCPVTFTKEIMISGSNPNPTFEVKNSASLCANVAVSFENKSTIGFGNISKIEWIFDYTAGGTNAVVTDSSPAVGKIYTHKYPSLAVKTDYLVVMRAYSGQLCVTESAPVIVTVYPAPSLKVNVVEPICESDDPIQLLVEDENNVSGTYVYSGTGVSSTGIFSPRISGPGTFNIKYVYTTDHGCIEEKNFSVTVNKLPTITMPAPIDILLGGKKQFEIKASGSSLKYKWSPSTGLSADNVLNPVASPEKTTHYTLTVTSNSCELVYEYTVIVHDQPLIPNVFSPNGDGKNDTWNIKYLESFTDGNITIFNRYGQKVFEASPYNTPWDGRLNGADLPIGVYYYIIEPNNGKKKYTGSVTILR
ncbi:PKD domain-containing protein [Pedobacter xixiisoli]|uniref:Gliding motility-associated C-terminal domain-containing protein n=1 Tax=Pedobacter xixiisoli TaxID=1476464 RepID=A0A285ZXS3_9SPHI|nr:PKD domain-containing protein [Pedobacter xixiisoli]SOD14445.1 gliding motility-associated C-terminal domain-containing protein [Pedobacter xixiisoli]